MVCHFDYEVKHKRYFHFLLFVQFQEWVSARDLYIIIAVADDMRRK